MADGAASVRALCEIAAKRGLMVDMHCDETDDPLSRHVETLAAETTRLGLQGRVTGSHLTSMHSMDNYYVSKLIALMAEARAQRHRQSAHQHRHPGPPRHLSQAARHDARARADDRRGLTVAFGHDCVMDPWYSMGSRRHAGGRAYGRACRADDQPRRHARLLRGGDGERRARSSASTATAWRPAAMPTWSCCRRADPIEAIRLKATRLHVVRRGKVIAETPAAVAKLDIAGRRRRSSLRARSQAETGAGL